MTNLTILTRTELHRLGAVLFGFGNLGELPAEARRGLPIGISVAVTYPKKIIEGISDLPTPAYRDEYNRLNERLDNIVTQAAEFLQRRGYTAIAQTRAQVGTGEEEINTVLPHKTVATRAGLGWIGKCALLVTEEYGSMVRLSSVLTDAPLETATPVNHSKCGSCDICKTACPAGAVSGKEWSVTTPRDNFYDPFKCRETARERSARGFGGGTTLCGKCIQVCPYTRRASFG
ncbi:MAG: epoxyqueuosine reductase [Defluviitaleaceae bacterium]|nr:epoxyqueuosine reductase [Defluviitaleaceae bacterium]MCL2263608.1 epoxyqueuosine reductase [Defluviitaleaceae bacterium]